MQNDAEPQHYEFASFHAAYKTAIDEARSRPDSFNVFAYKVPPSDDAVLINQKCRYAAVVAAAAYANTSGSIDAANGEHDESRVGKQDFAFDATYSDVPLALYSSYPLKMPSIAQRDLLAAWNAATEQLPPLGPSATLAEKQARAARTKSATDKNKHLEHMKQRERRIAIAYNSIQRQIAYNRTNVTLGNDATAYFSPSDFRAKFKGIVQPKRALNSAMRAIVNPAWQGAYPTAHEDAAARILYEDLVYKRIYTKKKKKQLGTASTSGQFGAGEDESQAEYITRVLARQYKSLLVLCTDLKRVWKLMTYLLQPMNPNQSSAQSELRLIGPAILSATERAAAWNAMTAQMQHDLHDYEIDTQAYNMRMETLRSHLIRAHNKATTPEQHEAAEFKFERFAAVVDARMKPSRRPGEYRSLPARPDSSAMSSPLGSPHFPNSPASIRTRSAADLTRYNNQFAAYSIEKKGIGATPRQKEAALRASQARNGIYTAQAEEYLRDDDDDGGAGGAAYAVSQRADPGSAHGSYLPAGQDATEMGRDYELGYSTSWFSDSDGEGYIHIIDADSMRAPRTLRRATPRIKPTRADRTVRLPAKRADSDDEDGGKSILRSNSKAVAKKRPSSSRKKKEEPASMESSAVIYAPLQSGSDARWVLAEARASRQYDQAFAASADFRDPSSRSDAMDHDPEAPASASPAAASPAAASSRVHSGARPAYPGAAYAHASYASSAPDDEEMKNEHEPSDFAASAAASDTPALAFARSDPARERASKSRAAHGQRRDRDRSATGFSPASSRAFLEGQMRARDLTASGIARIADEESGPSSRYNAAHARAALDMLKLREGEVRCLILPAFGSRQHPQLKVVSHRALENEMHTLLDVPFNRMIKVDVTTRKKCILVYCPMSDKEVVDRALVKNTNMREIEAFGRILVFGKSNDDTATNVPQNVVVDEKDSWKSFVEQLA